jgi:hypothetical protein
MATNSAAASSPHLTSAPAAPAPKKRGKPAAKPLHDTTQSSHPLSTKEGYKARPPVPILNIIIDNQTLEILEDRKGQT